MIYEYRVYTVAMGKQEQTIQNIHEFLALTEKHGVKALGVFHPIIGNANQLSYFMIYESMSHREKVWLDLATDEDMQKWYAGVRERDAKEAGPRIINTENTLLSSTEYSFSK